MPRPQSPRVRPAAAPCSHLACALVWGLLAATATAANSIFLDSTAPGNQAVVDTPYGSSIFMMQPGVNVNPAFKVEDGQANWSKNNGTGFSNSADMVPMPIYQVPVITYSGTPYIAIGIDFNETGSTPNFDVINLMLWAGPSSAQSLTVATMAPLDISSLTWDSSVSNQKRNSWQSGLRQMASNPNNTALGIDLLYQQNASPLLNVAGDMLPYGSDPYRVYSNGLSTLGSNQSDIAILVPYSVLIGRNSSDVLYLGLQTGSLNDGGSDRVGFLDPASLVSGGYLQQQGTPIITSFMAPDTTILVPEPSSAALLLTVAAAFAHRRRPNA